MPDHLDGYPLWRLRFDETGSLVGSGGDDLLAEAPGTGITDLFVFSHGWNNDERMAESLYTRFFGQLAAVANDQGLTAAIGLAGILWPSMRWPDEVPAEERAGGAASLDGGEDDDAAVIEALRSVYPAPPQQQALDEVEDLLARQPDDPDALERFHALLGVLADAPDVADADEDGGEHVLLAGTAEAVFDASADLVPVTRAEGAAGIGDRMARLWAGARQALRQTTYWEMKKRAGIVGVNGLAPLVTKLAEAAPSLRVHLLGHSFGARLVSYALRGIPDTARGEDSPVKSLTLLQGAFSHFAFAPSLPHAAERAGGLATMERRVDGPVVATYSTLDLALGDFYPWGSIAGRDDAAAVEDLLYRWGAIGHDGAQNSGAVDIVTGAPGQEYDFQPGRIHNVDANAVIVEGGGPSGAHSDIVHPELAWMVLAAAGLV